MYENNGNLTNNVKKDNSKSNRLKESFQLNMKEFG